MSGFFCGEPLLPSIGQALVHSNWGLETVAFSSDGRLIGSGSVDKTVCIYDAKTGIERCVIRGHSNSVNAVAFSLDRRPIVSGSGDS